MTPSRCGQPCAVLLCVGVCAWGCARSTMPDPKAAVRALGAASARHDAKAAKVLFAVSGQESLRTQDVERMLADAQSDLDELVRAYSAEGTNVRISARVPYDNGESALLDWEDGQFRVRAADALPSAPRSPEQALLQLRRALVRRSYPGLVRVLSSSTAAHLERDVSTLVDGLAEPRGLSIKVMGDVAVVDVTGGHRVRLRREAGVWKVEEFD